MFSFFHDHRQSLAMTLTNVVLYYVFFLGTHVEGFGLHWLRFRLQGEVISVKVSNLSSHTYSYICHSSVAVGDSFKVAWSCTLPHSHRDVVIS